MAALWERKARRYRDFEHLKPKFEPATATKTLVTSQLRLLGLLRCHRTSRGCQRRLDSADVDSGSIGGEPSRPTYGHVSLLRRSIPWVHEGSSYA
jgi:hypothetical protein